MLAFIPAFLLSMILTSHPLAAQPAANVGPRPPVQTYERIIFHRTTSFEQAAKTAAAAPIVSSSLRLKREHRGYRAIDVHPQTASRFAALAAAIALPTAFGRAVRAPDPNVTGFSGQTNYDQRMAGAGDGIYDNSQFDLEPPDQGLCVGNGFVLEPINDAIAAYTSSGQNLTGSVPLSAFFGLPPETIAGGPPFGPFLSDPKCYFDRDTQRWFVTELEFSTNPTNGADTGPSAIYIAVSQSSFVGGAYNVFSIDTTDYSHPRCPCFGDQPLIGFDNNGFYISTNEFPIFNPGFNGTQLYAISKVGLALGTLPPVVHIDVGAQQTPDLGGQWYSVQPAESPGVRAGQTADNGTEYLLSSLDFFNRNDDRVAVWSLTNTASLGNSANPILGLTHSIVRTEAYGAPPPATQKTGYHPLGQSLGEPVEELNSNDDRMNQVVYADHVLWSGVNTGAIVDGQERSGTAFFVIKPTGTPAVASQGYVAVGGENTLFPSIGVTAQGKAILTCTLAGPQYFPSAIYVPLAPLVPVRLASAGLLPDDGFTGYAAFGGNGVGRWGDYSAAVSDEYGNLWFATEYINKSPRTHYANWATYVGSVPAF